MTAALESALIHAVPPAFAPAFERLLCDGRQYFGSSAVDAELLETLQRAFSTVIHVRVRGSTSSRAIYIKRYRAAPGEDAAQLHHRVEWEFERTLEAYERLAGLPCFAPLRPLAAFPDLDVIVTEEAGGCSLQRLLARGALRWTSHSGRSRLENLLERIGAWIREYQAIGERDGAPIPLEDVRRYLEHRLDRVCAASPAGFDAADRERVLRACDRAAAALAPADLEVVAVHADFNPENILIDGHTICVLDFAEAHRGLRHGDFVHLYLHLERLKGRIRTAPRTVDALQAALQRGYGDTTALEQPLLHLLMLQQAFAYLTEVTEQCRRLARLTRKSYVRVKQARTIATLERLHIL